MFKVNRKEKIIELLNEKRHLKINELSNNLNVSIPTIHRDLDELAREGRLKKVFGGVVLNIVKDAKTKNFIKLNTNFELKQKIAERAVEYVENDDCIFIDNSSTCYYFAKALANTNYNNLVIVTNSGLIPSLFTNNENIQIVSTGGLHIKEMNCFGGPCAIATINEFNGNKFFFSVAGISLQGNLSDIYDTDLVTIKREMFKRSKKRVCLVDSTKFNKVGQSKIFNLEEIDRIITDGNLNNEQISSISKAGIDVIIA